MSDDIKHAIPTGTVTFLFTDIEGSTKRWEEHPQQMRAALRRHNALLNKAIETNNGYAFKTVGDAFCVAFRSPRDALQAAIDAQRTLADEKWPSHIGDLRVRMALHTGVADLQESDYFGQPVNRVARLLSVGYGGQTLLSLSTYELVRDTLPLGTTLRDMGERRLKDLIRPERVFQVVAPGLPSEFPPLKTLDTRPNNLPAQTTTLIGREKELETAENLLRRPEARLVTFTGPGGTGKTRLAMQVAADLVDHFQDGVYFVNLAPISDRSLVIVTVAQALDVRETSGTPISDTLKSYLREKELLLLLDNFEQVVEAAPGVSELLEAAPRLKVLTTSRVALRLKGEREYPVPPLVLPPLGSRALTPAQIERLTQYEAVRLFIERAIDVKPDFHVTNDNAPAVAEICVRLDGLPLAIELAAARVRLLTPQAMLSRLQSRLKLLTGGARDLPSRHQTLRAAIEWSYDLLSGQEKELFCRLAVFVGGRTLEAIETVCSGGTMDALDGVESLLSKSLLRQEEGVGGEPRYVMLETIHEYAREKLEESGEGEELLRRHSSFFLALAEEAEPHLRGTDQVKWLETLEVEYSNLRVVLEWNTGSEGDAHIDVVLRLISALQWFWVARGPLSEALNWVERALPRREKAQKALRAKAISAAGTLAWRQGDYLGAIEYHKEAVALYAELGDRKGVAFGTNNVAAQYFCLGDHEQGVLLLQESLALYRALDDKWGVALTLANLGEIARVRGDYEQARTMKEEALEIRRAIDDKTGISLLLLNLGHLAHQTNQPEQAAAYFVEGLLTARELRHALYTSRHIMGLAIVAALTKQPLRAGVLFGASASLIEATGMPLNPSDQAEYDVNLASARAQVDEATWQESWDEGRAMSLEQAVAYALDSV